MKKFTKEEVLNSMNRLKSLTLAVVISFFIFGILNLFVLNINEQLSHIP